MSTLGHALVGLLMARPSTGYDLALQLRRPVGFFWTAGHSQIYPELGRLESAGLVRHTVVAGAGPRDTKLYRPTPAGRAEVLRWLRATTADVDEREVLLRAYLLFTLPPKHAIDVVHQLRAHHEQALAHYRGLDLGPDEGTWTIDDTARMTWVWGITFEEQRIAWCDTVLTRLRQLL